MARHSRFDLPGIAQHIIQRGNNRLPCFLDDNRRHLYLHLLDDALIESGWRLHANVLMDNYVHLLATPPEAGALSRLMQYLRQRRELGQDSFRAMAGAKTRRFAGTRPAHRPNKPTSSAR